MSNIVFKIQKYLKGHLRNLSVFIFILIFFITLCSTTIYSNGQEDEVKNITKIQRVNTKEIKTDTKKEQNKVILKSNEVIANEVIKGLWGNGDERYTKLNKAGYDPSKIQSLVYQKLPKIEKAKPKNTSKTSNNSQKIINSTTKSSYETALTIWNLLLGYGYSKPICAGILGNIQQECGFNWNCSSRSGIGLCQWGGARRSSLISKYGELPSLENQVKFMVEELRGYSGIKNCKTVIEATDYFCYRFERPGIPCISKRRSYAEYWYETFN